MTISPLPDAPLLTDTPEDFNTKAFAFVGALDTFVDETNALAGAVNGDATSAVNAAASATSRAAEAAASAANSAGTANVVPWGAGVVYAMGDCVWSPVNFQTYRRKTAGAGATDPSADASNWIQITASATSDPTIIHEADIGSKVQAYDADLTSFAGKTAPAGAVLGTTDTQSPTNKTMGSGCVWNGGVISVTYGGTGAATLTGLVKGNGTGAFSAASAGTDYLAPDSALGTPASGTLTNCTADGTNAVGFKTIPQNSRSAAYTLVLGDSGKHIFHPSVDTTARIFTIPANASVAYPIGTALTFINQNAAGVVTISITTDTMRLAGAGSTGNRTLAANGVATAIKVTSTEWIISGAGLS